MCFLLPNSESVWFHFVVIINQLLGLSYTIRHKSSWRCLLLVHSACADHCSTIPIPVRTHQRTADFTTTASGVNDRQVYVITGEIKLLSDVLNRQDCFFQRAITYERFALFSFVFEVARAPTCDKCVPICRLVRLVTRARSFHIMSECRSSRDDGDQEV